MLKVHLLGAWGPSQIGTMASLHAAFLICNTSGEVLFAPLWKLMGRPKAISTVQEEANLTSFFSQYDVQTVMLVPFYWFNSLAYNLPPIIDNNAFFLNCSL